jgi:hypothetical protein
MGLVRLRRAARVLVVLGALGASALLPLVRSVLAVDPTTFTVTGHLTDTEGQPLIGPFGLVDCYVDAIDASPLTPNASAFSNAGAFVISGLDPATTYTIRVRGCTAGEGIAYAGTAWPTPVGGAAGEVVSDIDIALTETQVATLTVTVLSPFEVPIGGCNVVVVDQGSGMGSTMQTTNGAGQFTMVLPPDPVTMYLPYGCAGGDPSWYEGVDINDPASADVITLTPGADTPVTWHPNNPTSPSDTDPPVIACDPVPTAWQATEVTIGCTATDDGSGLADAGDASFDLSTSVGPDAETATASTPSREVCDLDGNCATAGPFTGLKVDRKAPTVTISAPTDGASVIIGATIIPSVSCDDGGSGVASCTAGSVAASTIGTATVTASVTDNVGNTGSASVSVAVRYGTCGVTVKTDRSGRSTITMKVCDAAGRNLSSNSLAVVGVSLAGPGGPVALVTPQGPSFVYVAKSRSYRLVIGSAGLPKGEYALGVHIGADPAPYSLRLRLR